MHRLITIGFSHYCEKARWALDHARVPYAETACLPGFHARVARRAAGQTSTPVLLLDDGRTLLDSTDIVLFAADHDPSLLPGDDTLRAEALALEARFDDALGPRTRRMAYLRVLPTFKTHRHRYVADAPAWQRIFGLPWALGVAALVRHRYRVSPERDVDDRRAVLDLFDAMAERFKDGRRYLMGETLTLPDIVFAALGAPVVVPDGYPFPLRRAEQPEAMRTLRADMLEHPMGQYIERLYRDERWRQA